MRLAFFLHSLGTGGAERVTVTLANHWASRGWEVRIITIAPLDQDRYPLHSAVRRTALDLAAASRGPFQGLAGNARRIHALHRELKRTTPDVAVAMMCRANVVLALASRGLQAVVCLGSERVYPPRLPMGRMWEWLRAVTYRWLDGIVVQTEQSRQWTARHTAARNVVTIPNPLVWPLPSQEPVRDPMGVGQGSRRRLLAVGRLERQKGFDLLVEAFRRSTALAPGWELVILGEGAERGALEEQIESAGLVDSVMLPGVVGNIGDWYAASDLFVLSSRFEGFPNALLEAMAAGLPALSTDCETGPGDIVQDGVNGILVPPHCADALGDALVRLMKDPELRARLSQRGVEVRERFSAARVAREWEATFAASME